MKPTEVTTCFPTLMDETAINLYVRSNLTKAAAGISQPLLSTSRDSRVPLEKER